MPVSSARTVIRPPVRRSPSRSPSLTASTTSSRLSPAAWCCSGAYRTSAYTTPSAARVLGALGGDAVQGVAGLHDGAGVREGLRYRSSDPESAASRNHVPRAAGSSVGSPVYPAGPGQLDDRGGAQAAVEVVVQHGLRGAADPVGGEVVRQVHAGSVGHVVRAPVRGAGGASRRCPPPLPVPAVSGSGAPTPHQRRPRRLRQERPRRLRQGALVASGRRAPAASGSSAPPIPAAVPRRFRQQPPLPPGSSALLSPAAAPRSRPVSRTGATGGPGRRWAACAWRPAPVSRRSAPPA